MRKVDINAFCFTMRALKSLSGSDNMRQMIEQFEDRLAQDLFDDVQSSATRRLPSELRRVARRKLLFLHDAAELKDLRVPPGNRLEALKGALKGFYAIRINDQWRVVFRWEGGNAFNVQIVDYHK